MYVLNRLKMTKINLKSIKFQINLAICRCAHSRAYEYFAESVYKNNGNNFIGTQCNSISALRNGRCTTKHIPMGIDTPHTAHGNYYLETNKKAPYGRSFQKFANIQQLAELIQNIDSLQS